MERVRILFKLIRVKHWSKSLFVFMGFLYSAQWSAHLYAAFAAALSFSLASSSVYIYNDIHDRELDRHHPFKKNRPIAARSVSITSAIMLLILLLTLALVIAALISPSAIMIISLYLAINIIYCHGLKHKVILDVLCISSGFMLRI